MINGKHYDYESIKVALPSGFLMMCQSVKYNDKKPVKVLTGMGGKPTGYGSGPYEGDCEVETEREDYENALKNESQKGFYNMKPLTITVTYADDGSPTITDTLEVKFDEREFGGKQGDESLVVKMKGKMTKPLSTNGAAAFVPAQ